jgi:energy-coupling factor transport system ATP-binding protein
MAFSLNGASMSYLAGTESERLAVDTVSLDVPTGTLVALVGTTGSGKSSLLQLLDGLALPDSGTAFSFGVDTAARNANLRAVRMRAPLAVQRPETAIFEAYAGDEVAFGPRNQGLAGQALVDRVRTAMDAAGLPFSEFRDRQPRTLSGGMKRRLSLASILSLDPDALLLDEPTSALDPVSRAEILALIHGYASSGTTLAGRPGRTVVMSTHSMDEAAAADLVAVMKSGAVVAFGPPSRVFRDDWDESWGLDKPFACQLKDAMSIAEHGAPSAGSPP